MGATADEFAKAHPAFSSNYTEDGSYTRLREVSMGVRLDQFLPLLKLDNAISGLSICLANNVKLWRAKGTVGVDPELNMSGAITDPIGTTGNGYEVLRFIRCPIPLLIILELT